MKSKRKEIQGIILLSILRVFVSWGRRGVSVAESLSRRKRIGRHLNLLRTRLSLPAELSGRKAAIIVPVFNNWKWTKRCLISLQSLEELNGVDIWIIDDCSTDQTVKLIATQFPDIRLIKNESNLGFLKSCNGAFEALQDKYELFFLLNNDTEVLPGFFSEALKCLDSKPEVAMVGSRLLYPNGSLQEAGGLVWRSGNAWNFGRGDNPQKPQYSVDREVDYASGAALLIKVSVLSEVGYFSPEFVPAYCEDSDLAFKMRAKGHQVWLAADSNVVHFEGKSNGTSLSSGVKSFQGPNQLRLRTKWASELANHFDEVGQSGLQAAFRLSPGLQPDKGETSDPLEALVLKVLSRATKGSKLEKSLAALLLRAKTFYLENHQKNIGIRRPLPRNNTANFLTRSFDALHYEQRGDVKFDPQSDLVVFISNKCGEFDHLARTYKSVLLSLGSRPVREVRILDFDKTIESIQHISASPHVKVLAMPSPSGDIAVLANQVVGLDDSWIMHLSCCSLLSDTFLVNATDCVLREAADFVVGKALLNEYVLGEAGLQTYGSVLCNPGLKAARGDGRFDVSRRVSALGVSPWLRGPVSENSEGPEPLICFEPKAVSYFQSTKSDLNTSSPSRREGMENLDWLFGAGTTGTVLFVEDEIPKPDRHAGDVSTLQYLDLLLGEGFSIIFWPRHKSEWSVYRERLLSKGVWVLDSHTEPDEWLRSYGRAIDSVWIARPHNAERLLPIIRRNSDAKIAYYTHDLHYLREEREGAVLPGGSKKESAALTKALEVNIFRNVDVVVSPSEEESELIRELVPLAKVLTVPLYFIEDTPISAREKRASQEPKSVVFIGGFPHTPNVTAAKILALEIMPIVWQVQPDTLLYLVGYAPPQQVRALANERVIVTGQVPDLEPYLEKADVFCAPLSFGAGVKGKIVEALKVGLPVVGTAIAFEGMNLDYGQDCLAAETADDLAAAILTLLSDDDLRENIGKSGRKAALAQFSLSVGLAKVREMSLGKKAITHSQQASLT